MSKSDIADFDLENENDPLELEMAELAFLGKIMRQGIDKYLADHEFSGTRVKAPGNFVVEKIIRSVRLQSLLTLNDHPHKDRLVKLSAKRHNSLGQTGLTHTYIAEAAIKRNVHAEAAIMYKSALEGAAAVFSAPSRSRRPLSRELLVNEVKKTVGPPITQLVSESYGPVTITENLGYPLSYDLPLATSYYHHMIDMLEYSQAWPEESLDKEARLPVLRAIGRTAFPGGLEPADDV